MKIFYRKSDNKFCGAVNIDKSILQDDEVLSIEIEEKDWLEFIQNAQEIFIEEGKLVSKEKEFTLEELKNKKIKEIKNQTSKIIKEKYPTNTQINMLNKIFPYTEEDALECAKFIENISIQGRNFQKELNGINNIEDLKNFNYKFKYKEKIK